MGYPHFTGEDDNWGDSGRICRRWNGPPPKIVTLCGSTRFIDEFQNQMLKWTLDGYIVLSVGAVTSSDTDLINQGVLTVEKKIELDELHKRKIDLADTVFVINVGGYVGDSTRSEIEYALRHHIPVEWLEPDKAVIPAEAMLKG